MDKINEVQILSNIRLSLAQKFVLAKIILPTQTPLTAYDSISTDKNVVANRDVLVKLGMVKIGQNEAEITDAGLNAMKNENLIDDTGNLTPQGEEFAYAKSLDDVENIAARNKSPEIPEPEQTDTTEPEAKPMGVSPQGIAAATDQGALSSFESWTMIADIQEELSQKEFLKKAAIKTKL